MGRSIRLGIERPMGRAALPRVALMFLVWALAAGVAAAAERGIACELLLAAGEQDRIPLEYRRSVTVDGQRQFVQGTRVQEGLASVFSGNPEFEAQLKNAANLHDGRIGPVTRGWLRQFCLDYPVHGAADAVPVAVMESILHYEEIAARHPDWKDVLRSPEFEEWLHNPADKEPLAARLIRRSGAAPVVNGLLDEFSASQSGEAITKNGSPACQRLQTAADPAGQVRFNLRSRPVVKKVQLGLQAVFSGDPEYDQERQRDDQLLDGRLGPHTRKWLTRLCESFPVSSSETNVQDQVVASALQYAEVAAVHPGWREILGDRAFNLWLLDAAPEERRRLRVSGSAAVINQLIAEYKAQRKPEKVVREPRTSEPDEAPGPNIYYRLTEKDWNQLQTRQAFIAQVASQVGERFEDEKALDEAVGLAAYDRGDALIRKRFLDLIKDTSPQPPRPVYRLTEASLKDLRDPLLKSVPEGDTTGIRFIAGVLSALAELQDQDFESKAELAQFVHFKAQLAWDDAVVAAQDSPETPESSPAAGDAEGAKGDSGSEPGSATEAEEPQAPTPPSGLTLTDGGDASAEASPEVLADDTAVPDGGDRKEEAPQRENAPSRITSLVGEVLKVVEEKVWPFEITPAAVESLRKDAGFVDFPEQDLEKLKALLDVAYASDQLYATAVRDVLARKPIAVPAAGKEPASGAGSSPSTEEVQAIVKQALKTDDAKQALAVKAASDCGCARRWDKVGRRHFVVYGFYPGWLNAPEAAATEPGGEGAAPDQKMDETQPGDPAVRVDFGIYSRIAYFSVKLDKAGEVVSSAQWSVKYGAKKLVDTAHRHLSEVDLVIEAPLWQMWGDDAIATAVEQIAGIVDPDSPDFPGSVKPDGVTLYFPGFDHSHAAAQENIVAFVTRLHERMNPEDGDAVGDTLMGTLAKSLGIKKTNRRFPIHLLINADRLELTDSPEKDESGRLLGSLKYLGGLSQILVGEKPAVDLVLVMLGQPVTELKKKLRLAVENDYQGEERIEVLRKIVPVMPPNGHLESGKPDMEAKWGSKNDRFRQLQHDLVYFRDNFRGVAFWPAVAGTGSTDGEAQFDTIKTRLIDVFSQSQQQGQDGQIGALLGFDPCIYVCPNRWYLIVFSLLLLGILVPVATLAYWSCRLRSFIARHTLPVLALLALLVLMFVAFIACIPALNDHQDSILGTLLAMLIAIAIFYYIRKVRQGPLP